jgi:hypothetical protein
MMEAESSNQCKQLQKNQTTEPDISTQGTGQEWNGFDQPAAVLPFSNLET